MVHECKYYVSGHCVLNKNMMDNVQKHNICIYVFITVFSLPLIHLDAAISELTTSWRNVNGKVMKLELDHFHQTITPTNMSVNIYCTYSSVGIAMGYRMDGLDLNPSSARFFSSPQHPDQLWGPPSLLFNGCKAARAWSWPLTSISCQDQERWSYISTLPYVLQWQI
jgi:hypothetical protein